MCTSRSPKSRISAPNPKQEGGRVGGSELGRETFLFRLRQIGTPFGKRLESGIFEVCPSPLNEVASSCVMNLFQYFIIIIRQ